MKLSREHVVRIASAQKLLLWTILLAIGINVAAMAINSASRDLDPKSAATIGLGILMASLGILVLQFVSVIRLCLALKEGWATGVYVIFQFVPCINLILLLFLNGRATARLKESGIRVGLMGASSNDVASYVVAADLTCPSCNEPIAGDVMTCPMCGAGIPAI